MKTGRVVILNLKSFLSVFLLCFACLGTASCARKPALPSLELALKGRQDSLSQQSVLRTAEKKQIAVLLKENEKIRSAMASFRPEDPGYGALAEALAENKASLVRLGYEGFQVKK